MLTKLFLAGSLCIFAVEVHADVVTQASCNVSEGQQYQSSISGPSSCSLTGRQGEKAIASVSAVLTQTGTNSFTAGATTFAGGYPVYGSNFNFYAGNSTASANLSATLSTSGPVRPGLVDVSGDGASVAVGNSGILSRDPEFTLGPVGGLCESLYCFNAGQEAPITEFNGGIFSSTPFVYALTLGQPVMFNLSQISAGVSDFFEAEGIAQAQDSFTFQFFESDGVTPVTVYGLAPEPNSLYLIALPGFFFGLRRHIRRFARSC